MAIMICLIISPFSLFYLNFESELIWINKTEWLVQLHFFPIFLKILNLNQKVGMAIMTCATSFFSKCLKKF